MRLLLLLAVTLSATAHDGHGKKSTAPASAKALKNPLAPAQLSLERGKALYSRSCAGCHDADGRSQSAEARKRTPPPTNIADHRMDSMKDGEIFWVISKGVAKTMPGFESQMSETDRWQVVAYVRHLRKARP